jgi:hypothetical protein
MIFVSYCSEDADLTSRVFKELDTLDNLFAVDIWRDADEIRAGDAWGSKIEEALAKADLAVLLVSHNFLASKFIKEQELPKLLERRTKQNLRLIPIFLSPGGVCPDWLSQIERRPRGKQTLSEIMEQRPSQVDRLLGEVMRNHEEFRGSGGGGRRRRDSAARWRRTGLRQPARRNTARHVEGRAQSWRALVADRDDHRPAARAYSAQHGSRVPFLETAPLTRAFVRGATVPPGR